MSSTIYSTGYCDECGGFNCSSAWCQLAQMGWDMYLEPDAFLTEENPFEIDGRWYFYDADSSRHGPFESEHAAEDEACVWLEGMTQNHGDYVKLTAGIVHPCL